jgi:hypothetical protein
MAQHSKYQQKIIKNYYENREAISLQRLSELVTELYLAEGKKRKRQWDLIIGHLEKLEIKPERIEYLIEKDDPALIAKLVEELMAKQ